MLATLAVLSLIAVGYLTLGPINISSPTTLEAGWAVQLWSGIAAAVGTTYFVVQPGGVGSSRTLNLQALGLTVGGLVGGIVPTTLTCNVEQTNDQGQSWQPAGTSGTGIALVAGTVATAQDITGLVPGPIYRINVTNLTLGNATSMIIIGSLS